MDPTILVGVLGVAVSALQLLSPKQVQRIANSLTSLLKQALPVLSSRTIRNVVVFLFGTILLGAILTLISFTLTNTSSSKPQPAPSQYSTYSSKTDVSNFTTKLTWDTSAIVQHSLSIAFNAQPTNSSYITKLSQKFGSGYTFFILAQLDTDNTTFTAEPKDQMQEPIEQGGFSFHWIATPLHPGDQAVDVIVKGIWMPIDSKNKQIEYYLGSHIWHISVADDDVSPIIWGQLNVFQALGYLATVFISVAFIQFVTTSIQSRKQGVSQNTPPATPQPSLTQTPTAQPVPSQSSIVQPIPNQPPVTQVSPASNPQSTQQPVP